MKRFTALAAALALTVGLTACGGESKYENTVKQGEEPPAAGDYEQAGETGSTAPEPQENGAAGTGDGSLSEQAEQVKRSTEVWEALKALPYFGDREQCAMSAEQAAGYAQMLADGIRGAIPVFDEACSLCYASYDTTNVAYWDQPFTVFGDGFDVESTRGYALLCDLAGDGCPYLLLMDEDTRQQGRFEDTSISIYGWQDGKAVQLFAYENMCRWMYMLYPLSNGAYGMQTTWFSPYGEDESCEEYLFLNGGLAEGRGETASMPEDQDHLAGHLAESCTLKEMVDKLNAYAAAESGGTVPAADYTFRTDRQRAAKEILELLKKRGEVGYIRLVDMDGDGSKELILDNETSPDQGLGIYTMKNGALKKVRDCTGTYQVPFEDTPWGMIVEESTLEKNKNNGTYAVRVWQYMIPGVSMLFTLTDQWTAEYNDYEPEDPDDPPIPARYVHNGKEISEEEYEKISDQYQPVDDSSGDYRQAVVNELLGWLK